MADEKGLIPACLSWLSAWALMFLLQARKSEEELKAQGELLEARRLGVTVEVLRFRARYATYKRRGLSFYQIKKEERRLRQAERDEEARDLMARSPSSILGALSTSPPRGVR